MGRGLNSPAQRLEDVVVGGRDGVTGHCLYRFLLPSITCNVQSHIGGYTVGNTRLQFQETAIKVRCTWQDVCVMMVPPVSGRSSVTFHPSALGKLLRQCLMYFQPPHSATSWQPNICSMFQAGLEALCPLITMSQTPKRHTKLLCTHGIKMESLFSQYHGCLLQLV